MAETSTRRVALLRGINVGGINIKMADLAQAFRDLGFADVRTVLASGNVLFTSTEQDRDAEKTRIEGALRQAFDYDAWVILVDIDDLERIVEAFPFAEDDDTRQPWVMFLASRDVVPDLLSVEGDLDPSVDHVQQGEGVLYWEVTKGQTAKSVFGKHVSRPRFKALTTTRNMRTLRKLLG